jgi:hypothetical protein
MHSVDSQLSACLGSLLRYPLGRRLSRSVRGMFPRDSAHQEHQMEVWCSCLRSLLCSVNDAVKVLPCLTCANLDGRLS